MSENEKSSFRIGTPEPAESTVHVAYADPSMEEPSCFGLSAWCIAPAIGGVAVLAAFPSAAIVRDPSSSPLYIIFNAAILLGIGFIGSLILFFVFGRSRPVASIAFTLVVTAISGSRFLPGGVAGAQAAMTRAVGLPVEVTKEQSPAQAVEPTPQTNLAVLAVSADTSSLSSAPAANQPNPKFRKSAGRWVRTASQLAATYRTAREAFEFGGGLEFTNIKSRRECNDRLSLLKRLQHANESYAGYINSAPQTLRKLLREEGVNEEEVDPLIEGFVGGFDYDLQVSLRQTRAEFISNAQAMLQLARDREGHWTLDPQTELITFKSSQDTKAYAEHAKKAHAAAARDLEIQRDIETATQSGCETLD